jgi:hypothetical protein
VYISQEQCSPVQSRSQKSKSLYDRRSVNLYVLVPSPRGLVMDLCNKKDIDTINTIIELLFPTMLIWQQIKLRCKILGLCDVLALRIYEMLRRVITLIFSERSISQL